MKRLIILCSAAVLCLSSAKSWADGTGLTVTGSFTLPSNPGVNYFDSANGAVPAGYGNSSNSGTAVIGSGIEFAAVDSVDYLTVDFTATTLTITDVCLVKGSCGLLPTSMTLYSPDITGYTITSFDFPDTTVTFGYDAAYGGDALTITYNGTPCPDGGTATFDYTTDPPSAVPEPGSLGLMATGLMGAAGIVRRRFNA